MHATGEEALFFGNFLSDASDRTCGSAPGKQVRTRADRALQALSSKNDFDLLKMASRPYYRHHALTTSAMAATSGSKTQQLSKVVTEHTLR